MECKIWTVGKKELYFKKAPSMYRKKIKDNDTHASLIYVVAMEMQMPQKLVNGTNEYFQINLVPIDQSIKVKIFIQRPSPPPS